MSEQIEILQNRFSNFPGTRYMGSKNKIINRIWDKIANLKFQSFYDVFGGSNVVGYFAKCQGKRVITNDFLSYSHNISKAIIENSFFQLEPNDVNFLLHENNTSNFIQNKFGGLFFDDADNKFLDSTRQNIELIKNEFKKAIALAALSRACMKKRSRGIFTFVGERYDDGRRDLKISMKEHFIESVLLFNNAVFDNGQTNISLNERAEDKFPNADIIYLDPPYFTPNSDNDYTRRYHFVEGLVRNWEGIEIQEHTLVKKFKSYTSPFSKRNTSHKAFEDLISHYRDSIIAISYSSNSLPTKEELTNILKDYKKKVVVHEMDLTYSIGNQTTGNSNNKVKEYLFVAS